MPTNDSSDKVDLKGRVQCNEPAQLTIPGNPAITCRLRELNWLGFTLDHIDTDMHERIVKKKGQPLNANFQVPREFGIMNVDCFLYTLNEYTEISTGGRKLMIAFDLEGHSDLEKIREFVTYRNRRFSRHHSYRRSAKFFQQNFILKWFLLLPALVLIALTLVLSLRHYF